MNNHPALQNPPRLTRKQQWFLETVLDAGCPLEQAMADGRITPRLLHSWLQQPRFLHAVEIRMAQYRLETRIEAARAACQAVHTLARITAHAGRYDIVRQAGMDLVKIHHDLENEKQPQPMAQKSAAPLNYQQSPPKPLRSPCPLALKCAPTSPRVQNPALKCARPVLSGFKMRAACAPRRANSPKNPIFSPKTHKTPLMSFLGDRRDSSAPEQPRAKTSPLLKPAVSTKLNAIEPS